jgi:hypothetical protein
LNQNEYYPLNILRHYYTCNNLIRQQEQLFVVVSLTKFAIIYYHLDEKYPNNAVLNVAVSVYGVVAAVEGANNEGFILINPFRLL